MKITNMKRIGNKNQKSKKYEKADEKMEKGDE